MIGDIGRAWLVHAFTALGIVCALCAARAAIHGAPEQAFFWLGVAFVIDGVDGYFARRYRVEEVLPQFSGKTLDLVIDYVTYVFVPALMLMEAGYLSGPIGLAMGGAICMSSLYHFSDAHSKADDHCFVGFPAVWNIVAFYIFAFAAPGWMVASLIITCVGLTFIRFKWVHPMRVARLRSATAAATGVWALAAAVAVYQGFPASAWVQAALAGVAIYGLGLSIYFGRDPARPGWPA